MTDTASSSLGTTNLRSIVRLWFPLWMSWLTMALEFPLITSFVARLPQPEIALAVIGGVLFPIAFTIESPIIMLLSASNALSRDKKSYAKIVELTTRAGIFLTGVHVLCSQEPFYSFITIYLLGTPDEVREAAQIGLVLLFPWSWAIAHRRVHQGVLIRCKDSRSVGMGTLVRLGAGAAVCGIGTLIPGISGVVLAAAALSAAVMSECLFIYVRARLVIEKQLSHSDPDVPELTTARFLKFYWPLALTAFLEFLTQPLSSAAMGRMAAPIESLAAFPVMSSFTFIIRSPSLALTEVAIAFSRSAQERRQVKRFTLWLAVGSLGCAVLVFATPLTHFWLGYVMAVPPHLISITESAMWISLAAIVGGVYKNLYQGIGVVELRTALVRNGTVWNILGMSISLAIGVMMGNVTGLLVVAAATSVGVLLQLWYFYFVLQVDSR